MNVLNKVAEMLAGTSIGDIDINGVDGDVISILQSQGLITIENNIVCYPYKVKSFGEYCFKVFLQCPEDMRLGQWATVLFSRKFPDVKVPEDIDPFYNDSKLPEFIDFAAQYRLSF
jgi:hypothetical protein